MTLTLEERVTALEQKPSQARFTQADGVTLKEYFEAKFDALERAQEKADRELAAKFTTVNEFRGTLSDQAATLVTKDKIDAIIGAFNSRIGNLEQAQARQEGKASQTSVYIAYGIALISIVMNVLGYLK